MLGGPVVGAGVGAALGGTAGVAGGPALGTAASKSVSYLADRAANIGAGWKPIVFGDWYSAKISKLLK